LTKYGRDDRGRAYEQQEVVAMLNGEMPARNGKSYSVGTNRSQLSRTITGKLKPQVDLLTAICDLFDTDIQWLIKGEVAGELSQFDHNEF